MIAARHPRQEKGHLLAFREALWRTRTVDPLSMKEGPVSTILLVMHRPVGAAGAAVVGGERGSSLYRLLEGGRGWIGARSGGASPYGPSGGQGVGGACRSEGLVAGEHVPDRLGEPAGEVDLGDLGAALSADARLRLLVAVAVGGVAAGVGGRLDERPAQVAGPCLASGPRRSRSPDW
jgi:hypothetical protein